MTLKISQLTPVAVGSLDGSEPVELGIAGDKSAPNGAFIPQGYIDGLKMQWVSATALTVSSGAAYVLSLGRVIRANAAIALTGLVLTPITWYHVYLYSNAGVPAIEVVPTSPAAPYNGVARTKTSDTSRRYIGSVLTDSTSNLMNFDHCVSECAVHYKYNINNGGLHVLSGGAALTSTLINFSGVVPVSGMRCFAYVENTGNDIAYIGPSDLNPITTVISFVRPSSRLSSQYLMFNQQMNYEMGSANTSGGLDVWVQGYIYER